jgi:predicted NBD/HSP70 family sugar kinase
MARASADAPLPRQAILREITDGAVLRLVLRQGRVTRADVARATGISKPTISLAMARLEAAGLLMAAGLREGQPGRVATWYELAPTSGWVLGLDVDADGVHLRATDLAARTIEELDSPPVRPGDVAGMVLAIREAVHRVLVDVGTGHGLLRAVALSVANAVRPDTGEVLSLPDTPFPEGLVNPREVFTGLVTAPVMVENDINCAALAEHRSGAAVGVDNFAYLFVGAGIGMGVYVDGRLARGAHGTAGKIGYLAAGRGGESYSTLVSALARQGFARDGSSAIDVRRVRATLAAAASGDDEARDAANALGTAIGQVIADTAAVIDPELVLLGGPLGADLLLLPLARQTAARLSPSPVRIEYGSLGEAASLHGALHLALDHALAGILVTS